ncbi:MAG: hypothetical protein IPL28_21880 [Chloroflexi bacterium]|nr:hypothetical protein [Chloroflexota bacterium]
MQIFDTQNFRQFLGSAECNQHRWGLEKRYVVTENTLAEYEHILRDTLYHHHSSFNAFEAITELGFPLVANAMRQRNSSNPIDENTQMGNLGEVIGREYSTAFLGFATTWAYPNRFNPNIEQSMKGVDIIGLRDVNQPAEILVGEAKAWRAFDKRPIKDAYNHLIRLRNQGNTSQMLRFVKESASTKGDRQILENIDRHMANDVIRHYLILSITEKNHENLFEIIESILMPSATEFVSGHISKSIISRGIILGRVK